jgi:hypothetical protein
MPVLYESAFIPMTQLCRTKAGFDSIRHMIVVTLQSECAYSHNGIGYICVVKPKRCRVCMNPHSTQCRRYAVQKPGLIVFRTCLSAPFSQNAHTFRMVYVGFPLQCCTLVYSKSCKDCFRVNSLYQQTPGMITFDLVGNSVLL